MILLLRTIMIVLFVSLIGCQQNTSSTENLTAESDLAGFVEPEPSDWVKYITPVREYYRTQAVVNKDIHILWDRYPILKRMLTSN